MGEERVAVAAAAEAKRRAWEVWVVGARYSPAKQIKLRTGWHGKHRGGYEASNSRRVSYPQPKDFLA